MARKKAEVTEVTEEIKNAEPIVETTPEVEVTEEVVEEKPKRGRKKKVEEPVEEVKAEEPTAEEIPEVKEEPVVEPEPIVEEVKEEPAKVESSSGMVIAKMNLYVLKVPGNLATKLGSFKAGTKFTILEESKGWGKIAEGKWINLNYVEKI